MPRLNWRSVRVHPFLSKEQRKCKFRHKLIRKTNCMVQSLCLTIAKLPEMATVCCGENIRAYASSHTVHKNITHYSDVKVLHLFRVLLITDPDMYSSA